MKTNKHITAIFSTVIVIFACEPDKDMHPATMTVVANKSQVKTGETVFLKVDNGTAGAVAKWSVVPNTNVVINRAVSWDQKNSIIFNQQGNYTVIVEIRKVWCDSVAASHPGMDTCLNGGTTTGNLSTLITVNN